MDPFLSTFKALSDATRLRILRVLRSGAFHVSELVGVLEMGQSRVSRHLKILLDADLVVARREGSWVYYTLSERWVGHAGLNGVPGRFLRVLSRELGADRSSPDAERDRLAVDRCLDERRRRAESFFRNVADDWDSRRESVQGPPDHLDRLVASLHATARNGRSQISGELGTDTDLGTVVDLGTGTGILLETLSQEATRVIGIDAAPEMLDVARASVSERGLDNVDLRLGALEHLPIPNAEADLMVANMVLHHVAHPPAALREVRRGLRQGGRFVVADFSAHGEESYRERLGDLWLGFDRQELERWLDEAEFDLEHVTELPQADHRPGVLLVEARARAHEPEEHRHSFQPDSEETLT